MDKKSFPILEPSNMVEVGGIQIWLNRPLRQWHGPYSDGNGFPSYRCPNSCCPYENHGDEGTCYDPFAMILFDQILAKGVRILMMIDYCKKQHVSLVTVRKTEVRGWPRFCVEEPSRDLYFFRPVGQHRQNIGLDVHWYSVRYAAIIPSGNDAEPFGKYGGVGCFVRELARVTGQNATQIRQAIRQLENMNSLPLLLKPVSPFARHLDECVSQGIEAFQETLTNTLWTRPFAIAELVLAHTQSGNWENLKPILAGWPLKNILESRNKNVDAFQKLLEEAVALHLKQVPRDKAKINTWWAAWSDLFPIGDAPSA